MRMLRFGLCLGLIGGAWLAGCGDDDRTGTPDTGVVRIDGGPGVDSGPPPDTGPGIDTGPSTGTCPSGACDIVGQTGCSAGEGCYLNGTDPICAAAGTAADGAACATPTDCMEGFTCQDSVCRHWCCGNDDGCPTGQTCLIQLVDETGNPIGAGLCRLSDSCDPLTQMGCANAGDGCYIAGADGTVLCAPAGAGGEGDTCAANNDCMAGFTCAAPTSGGGDACRQICAIDGSDPMCPSGQACAGFSGSSLPYGACLPM